MKFESFFQDLAPYPGSALRHAQLQSTEKLAICMLQEMDLSNNGLSGTLPDLINYCQDLLALDLSNNSLSGPLPNLLTVNRIKVCLHIQ